MLRDESHLKLGAELADRAATYVEEHELPASDRTSVLLRASSLLDSHDSSLAHDYYERAVVAAAGIDDDSVTLLELHAEMARRLAQGGPHAPSIAHRLISLVEAFATKVSDDERLPYRPTLLTVASLHAPSAFAAASRWDDEARFAIEEAIEPLVTGAVSSTYLSPRDGAWLFRIRGERVDPSNHVLPYLDRLVSEGQPGKAALRELTADLALWIARDIPMVARPGAARRIVEWADSANLATLPAIAELRELADYAERLATRPGGPDSRPYSREWAAARTVQAPADSTELAAGLAEVAQSFASDRDIEAFIETAAQAAGPASRVDFLEELIGLPSDHAVVRWHAEALVNALHHLLHGWRHSGPVRAWALDRLPIFVEQHFVALVAYAESAARTLRALFCLPLIENPSSLLLRGLASHLDDLTAAQLFGVAEAIASVLDDSTVSEVLSWSMGRLEAEGQLLDPPELPADADSTLAAFLFALFGNVDKRTRWRAAHVARAFARGRPQGFVAALVTKATEESAGCFVAPSYPFYWLSARQWLMAVLARVADEQPEALRPHLDVLVGTATSSDIPHAAIRDMAKRAALSVVRAHPDALDEERLQALHLANEPRSCLVDRSFRYGRGNVHEQRKDERFHFDSIDTLPYWYAPLGQIFDLSALEIAARAEPWIIERLGYTNDDVWNDRRELSREREYDQVRNDHGSIPVLETLRTYLEYHGMLLAAGAICDEGIPAAHDEWEDSPGPWRDWLGRHIEVFPQAWLSDLRQPAPLERFVYAPLPPIDAWLQLSKPDFDEHLFIERNGEAWICVDSSLHLHADDRRSNVYGRVALVASETASSLMCAYQSALDPSDYLLPYEDSDEFSPGRAEIHDGEFTLRGLLVRISRDRDSLEEHDPLRRISLSFERPGRAFAAAVGVTSDETALIFRDGDGRIVSETQLWSDAIGDEREYTREPYTEGVRTLVPLPTATSRQVVSEAARAILA